MPSLLDSVPQERINALASWLGVVRRGRTSKDLRDEVVKAVEGRPHRTTPWGIQFLRSEDTAFRTYYFGASDPWVPPFPYQGHAIICGRWIRDIEAPESWAGHPRNCTCFGRPPPRIVLADQGLATSGVLTAFLPGDLTDPSVDLAPHFAEDHFEGPQTTRCIITELPQELLDLILSHVVPEGQTYHFLPARSERKTVQLVQKLVPEHRDPSDFTAIEGQFPTSTRCTNIAQSIQDCSPANPMTGSAYLSLAATCKQLQHPIYKRFYSGNAFIFHLTAHTIHSSLRSNDFSKFCSWSRTVAQAARPLGTLTRRTASYLKDVTLIASLPHSHGSQDINALSEVIRSAATSLADARLDRLAIHFEIAPPNEDKRFRITAIPIDRLQADVDTDGKLDVRIREPIITPVRESNRAQQVLRPLLQGPKGVKEVEISGPLGESFVAELKSALQNDATSQPAEPTPAGSTENRKKRRLR